MKVYTIRFAGDPDSLIRIQANEFGGQRSVLNIYLRPSKRSNAVTDVDRGDDGREDIILDYIDIVLPVVR